MTMVGKAHRKQTLFPTTTPPKPGKTVKTSPVTKSGHGRRKTLEVEGMSSLNPDGKFYMLNRKMWQC